MLLSRALSIIVMLLCMMFATRGSTEETHTLQEAAVVTLQAGAEATSANDNVTNDTFNLLAMAAALAAMCGANALMWRAWRRAKSCSQSSATLATVDVNVGAREALVDGRPVENCPAPLDAVQHCAKLGVLGISQSGLTHILSHIGNFTMPSGPALNQIRITMLQGLCRMLVVDACGRGRALQEVPDGISTTEALKRSRELDDLKERIIAGLCSALVIVVPHATLAVQEYLVSAIARLSNLPHMVSLAVVHNLREKTDAQLHANDDAYVKSTKNIVCSADAQIVSDTTTYISDSMGNVTVKHFFTTNEAAEGCRNAAVYDRLRYMLNVRRCHLPLELSAAVQKATEPAAAVRDAVSPTGEGEEKKVAAA